MEKPFGMSKPNKQSPHNDDRHTYHQAGSMIEGDDSGLKDNYR